MKTLVWIGSPFFQRALADQGLKVHFWFLDHPCVVTWRQIVERAGFEPDAVVVADKSYPPFVARVENFPCLTIFYCVDSHIHSWYPVYAQAFDLCTVSLRDHVPQFQGPWLDADRVLWLPAFAKDEDLPSAEAVERQFDLLFVGTVDADRTPARKVFMDRLSGRIPGLVLKRGDYRHHFPQGKVILNYAERGDLNFRVFEALGCASCLVTPRVGHGLEDIFEDGRDLFLYDQEDMDGLVSLVEKLLADGELRRRAAASGLAKVDREHRAAHRAAAFHSFLTSFSAEELVRRRLGHSSKLHDEALRLLYLHQAEVVDLPELKKAYYELATYRPL